MSRGDPQLGRGRSLRYNPPLHAGVAQLVEQRIRNAKVGSSTLLTGTMKGNRYAR